MISIILTLVVAVILVPTGFFCIEVLGFFLPNRKIEQKQSARSEALHSVVIIPAHNEGQNIVPTLEALLRDQVNNQDVLVIADNCTDDTAEIARATLSGLDHCSVIERHDESLRGKGFALDFGLQAISDSPPDVVIIMDADCLPDIGAMNELTHCAATTGRPVQSMYLMNVPNSVGGMELPKLQIAAFAWLIMNKVRMTGLFNLFNVTRLTGSGMAFPYHILRDYFSGTKEIVEDLALTVKLVRKGHAPLLRPDVFVYSEFAPRAEMATTQRARWEQGSMAMIAKAALPLFWDGLKTLDNRKVALSLDVAIAPLVMLLGSMVALILVLLLPLFFGIAAPLVMVVLVTCILLVSLLLAWITVGRQVLPMSSFYGLVGYVVHKFRIHGMEGRNSTKVWTRTDRDKS